MRILAMGLCGLLLTTAPTSVPDSVVKAAGPGSATAAAEATRGKDRIEKRLRAAVRALPVARERRAGYDRDRFEHWVDADNDCYDTRDEVLRAESRRRVSGGSCDVARGRWFSYYDHRSWSSDDDVDIDHLVPLAESWDSGARRWDRGTRRRFANDLRERRTLIAVTDNVNQSKGDQDVSDWLPEYERCHYVRQWVAVKLRWSLRVDRNERQVLQRRAGACPNGKVSVRTAAIGIAD